MIKLITTIACLVSLWGCGNSDIRLQQIEKDKAYKDSLSMADGRRALGNFYFGMCRDSFEREKRRFLHDYHNKLYGKPLQTIDAKFNYNDQLCQVIFVSPNEPKNEKEEHPYYEFAKKKFGLETGPNTWQVGRRRIVLTVENRSMDRDWFLERAFERNYKGGFIARQRSERYRPWETFDYYVMTIEDDSLGRAYKKEAEINKQRFFEEEDRKMREADEAEERAREKQFQEL